MGSCGILWDCCAPWREFLQALSVFVDSFERFFLFVLFCFQSRISDIALGFFSVGFFFSFHSGGLFRNLFQILKDLCFQWWIFRKFPRLTPRLLQILFGIILDVFVLFLFCQLLREFLKALSDLVVLPRTVQILHASVHC